jgi:hypothetical protein
MIAISMGISSPTARMPPELEVLCSCGYAALQQYFLQEGLPPGPAGHPSETNFHPGGGWRLTGRHQFVLYLF